MTIFELLGYIGALIMGFVLGLFGGGGSILSIPILVYLFGIQPVLATAYSLFIVGVVAATGTVSSMRKGLVNYPTAIAFAIPSFMAVFFTRAVIIPAIPDQITQIGSFLLTKDILLMLLFAVIMLLASISMLRKKSNAPGDPELREALPLNYPIIALDGLIVGFITGMVGAGGGFLIIPALVLLVGLPMKIAVGTSLFIVTIKSLIGFLGDLGHQTIDWSFLTVFSGIAMVGMLVGGYASNYISNESLKKGFGWFILTMAIFILTKELFL